MTNAETVAGKRWGEWIQLAIGMATISLIAYFLFSLANLFLDYLREINATVGAALVGSMTTVIVGVGGALITHYQIRKRQAEESHREEKVKLYSRFLDMAAAHLAEANPSIKGRKIPQKQLLDFFLTFKTGLILRGSVGVIRAMAKFEDVSVDNGDVLDAVDEIYREIRKDVGLSNAGLKRKGLVSVYLTTEARRELRPGGE